MIKNSQPDSLKKLDGATESNPNALSLQDKFRVLWMIADKYSHSDIRAFSDQIARENQIAADAAAAQAEQDAQTDAANVAAQQQADNSGTASQLSAKDQQIADLKAQLAKLTS